MEQKTNDNVNHPAYYNNGKKKECIDAMNEVFGDEKTAAFCLLNAFKYLWRREQKESAPMDTAKAQWYIDRYNTMTEKHLTIDTLLKVVELYIDHEAE